MPVGSATQEVELGKSLEPLSSKTNEEQSQMPSQKGTGGCWKCLFRRFKFGWTISGQIMNWSPELF